MPAAELACLGGAFIVGGAVALQRSTWEERAERRRKMIHAAFRGRDTGVGGWLRARYGTTVERPAQVRLGTRRLVAGSTLLTYGVVVLATQVVVFARPPAPPPAPASAGPLLRRPTLTPAAYTELSLMSSAAGDDALLAKACDSGAVRGDPQATNLAMSCRDNVLIDYDSAVLAACADFHCMASAATRVAHDIADLAAWQRLVAAALSAGPCLNFAQQVIEDDAGQAAAMRDAAAMLARSEWPTAPYARVNALIDQGYAVPASRFRVCSPTSAAQP